MPTPWVKTDLLISHGLITPLGASGLAFDHTETAVFVGNTGDHTIIRVPVVNGEAGQPEVWVTSISGPDGMSFDEEDRLWVVANRADEVVVLDKTRKDGREGRHPAMPRVWSGGEATGATPAPT